MNRTYIITSLLLTLSFLAVGQNNNDSILLQQLDEVVVKASRRFEKGDTLSVIPSANQRKFSVSGFELLRSMMFPGLKVNVIAGELSLADGGSAIVLINGRPVERQDIMALRPQEVARIEYVKNPGPEYGYDQSLGAVINVIMKKRTDGYAAGVTTYNAVTTANGENFAYGKYSRNNSEYAISFNSDYTSLSKRRIDDTNTYMTDGNPLEIVFKGINSPLKFTENTLQACYNHFLPDRQIFDVTFKGVFYYSPDRAYAQKVMEDGASPYFQLTEPYEKYLSPRLNIYYKRYLTKRSTLTANVVGNYRHTDYHYNMYESLTDDFDTPVDSYQYGTKSNRQSYIGEIKYLNNINRLINISIGTRASYSYTSNRYTGDESSIDKLHDTNIYAYTSAYGYLGKLYYSAGIGVSGRITSQNGQSIDKWMLRPELQFFYRVGNWRFNLHGIILQDSPSLSEMASTEFRVNRLEIKKGNPGLTDWWKYRLALRINGKLGPVNLQNSLSYVNARNPVMPFVERMNNQDAPIFITSFYNQRRMSILTNSLSLDCGLSDNLSISAGVNFKSYQSRGIGYSHNLGDWQYNIAADWYSGDWNAGIIWRSAEKSLSGETFSYTGSSNTVYVNYVIANQLRLGLMGQYLFCKNGPTFKEELRDRYMIKNENIIIPAQKNMIIVSIAWNFSVGKQRKEANIDMTNEDNESGIFK